MRGDHATPLEGDELIFGTLRSTVLVVCILRYKLPKFLLRRVIFALARTSLGTHSVIDALIKFGVGHANHVEHVCYLCIIRRIVDSLVLIDDGAIILYNLLIDAVRDGHVKVDNYE